MVIYIYDIGDAPIKQGDIFKNIPYLSFDVLVRSSPIFKDSLENEAFNIIEEIIHEGGEILVETIISTTLCILASQDCDITHENFLIFYPLEIYQKPKDFKSLINEIRDSTQSVYLPSIDLPNSSKIGPFRVKFREPIKLPKNLITKHFKELRIARIRETGRKVFIGKLTNFYSRLPIDDVIFLENNEIEQFLVEEWKKTKKDNVKMSDLKKNIKWSLTENNRGNDIDEIYFDEPIDFKIIEDIRINLNRIQFMKDTKTFLELCEEFKGIESLREQKQKYDQLKNRLYEDDDNLVSLINSEIFQETFLEKIEKFRSKDIKTADNAEKAIKFLKNIKKYLS